MNVSLNVNLDVSRDPCLEPAPEDTISSLAWSPSSNPLHLASWGWSNNATISEISENGQNRVKLETKQQSPLLSLAWHGNGGSVFLGGCDNTVKLWDLNSGQLQQVGQHSAPVCQVVWCQELNHVISASWDGSIAFWNGQQQTATQTMPMGGKIFAMGMVYPMLVTALADCQIVVMDLTKIGSPAPPNRSHLRDMFNHGIRCLAVYPDASGCAFGSAEGRVSFNKIQLNPVFQVQREYTFKCHKDTNGLLYPIHAMAASGKLGTIATAGGDGNISFWDRNARSKLKNLTNIQYPVTAIDIHKERGLLAYAAGYDWNMGIEGARNQPTKLCYRELNDDFKSKT